MIIGDLERIIQKEFGLSQSKNRYTGMSKFYLNFNENFRLFVNFNYESSRIEFGLALTSKLDEPSFLLNFGIDTTSSNLRECIRLENIDNEKCVIDKIDSFIKIYEQLSKEKIKCLIKAKRDTFRNLIHSRFKTLGFKRKNNTWEYHIEKYRIELYLAKLPFSDTYDFYCWVYDIDSSISFQYVRERMIGADNKTVLFDWILDEDLFINSLDIFIRDIITPLLMGGIEKLSFYRRRTKSSS